MRKTPTLEEVKEHFKNSKKVKCLADERTYNVSNLIISKEFKDAYRFFVFKEIDIDIRDSENMRKYCVIWDEEKGYAEIISHINSKTTDSPSKKESYDFINPNHYKSFSKEVIDMMIDLWGKEAVATHCEITAFKYKMRIGSKPDQPIERDLEKSNWYLAKAKELIT